MSIVSDQVRRVDSQLDRLQLGSIATIEGDETLATTQTEELSTSPQITHLQTIIKALSTTSSSRPLLSSSRIQALLDQASLSDDGLTQKEKERSPYLNELEWLLIGKATVQIYGLILNILLEQTIPLTDDILYWDEILGSYTYSGLYTLQTSPLRLWAWTKDVYRDAEGRFARLRQNPDEALSTKSLGTSLTAQWRQFYSIVQESIRHRSIADVQQRVLSPIALARAEARRKQKSLRKFRELCASGLGILMDEGLTFDIDDDGNSQIKGRNVDSHEWKGIVERSVALMDTILQMVTALETGVPDFEDAVFASVEDDPEISSTDIRPEESRPAKIAKRLNHILKIHITSHITASKRLASEYGRPSRIIRYWPAATLILLSSTTILRVLTTRKDAILSWVMDLGTTIRDFWFNWVIEPVRKIIGTIRHDKDSEVAIMSRESLKGDRESLERMVVDFAIENPEVANVGSGGLTEPQIEEIRNKVKEGDLTPILRAYEKDLRRPFMGTLRGDLIRTLLIQVQKTKVDVEVAISGIDAILKSQELVFGFIGLTPSILICFGVFRYLGGIFGNRRGSRRGKKAGQSVRILRNIDRILILSTPSQNGMCSYKDHGLLLSEMHILRKLAKKLFPGDVAREFLEDMNELGDISVGIERQLKVLERIRWAYGKWLSN